MKKNTQLTAFLYIENQGMVMIDLREEEIYFLDKDVNSILMVVKTFATNIICSARSHLNRQVEIRKPSISFLES